MFVGIFNLNQWLVICRLGHICLNLNVILELTPDFLICSTLYALFVPEYPKTFAQVLTLNPLVDIRL